MTPRIWSAPAPSSPATPTPGSILAGVDCFAQLPLVRPSGDLQTEHLRQCTGLQQQPIQFIPPELTLVSYVPGSKEDRRRNFVACQQRLGVVQIICVSVIKGDGHCPFRQAALKESPEQSLEAYGMSIPLQNLEVFSEIAGCHTQKPGIQAQFSDAVIEQDEHPLPRSIPRPSSNLSQSSNATPHNGGTSGFIALRVIRTS
jgi:hypothetical protein